MYNLPVKCIDVLKKSKDTLTSQLTTAEKQNLVACLASMGATHVAIVVLMDDTSVFNGIGVTPSPRTVEAETQDWCDVIHAQDSIWGTKLRVVHRGTFGGTEGPGNSFGIPYDTVTSIGTPASASTDGNSTWCGRWYRYLYNHVGDHVMSGDIFAPIPEATTHQFDQLGVTISIASPAVITATAHGIANGTAIHFLTDGALPTGLNTSSTYYVSVKDANSFWVYDTLAHAQAAAGTGSGTGVINTSGSQSGTQKINNHHWFVPSTGSFSTLFINFHAVMDSYATAKGVSLTFQSHNNYSEVRSGNIGSSLFTDQNFAGFDYYGQYQGSQRSSVADYKADLDAIWSLKGVPMGFGEWGDIGGQAVPTADAATIEKRLFFEIQFYKMLRDYFVDTGKLTFYSAWAGWEGQNTSFLYKTGSGASSQYFPNARGKILAAFYKNQAGISRVPVITSGASDDTYTY